MILRIDSTRESLPETGIYVRGLDKEGRYDSIDINHLTRTSLIEWIRSRPEPWQENIILVLLGHTTPSVAESNTEGL